MPDTSLALLSWSEQVSQPHTRCSKGSPLGEAPRRCYCHLQLPHRTLPARNSPSSSLQSHTHHLLRQQVEHHHLAGESTPRRYVPHRDSLKPANEDPVSPQTPCRGSCPPHAPVFRDARPQSCSLQRADVRGRKPSITSSLQTNGLDQTQIHKPKVA